MATTPHSSWNLSNMRFKSVVVGGLQIRDEPAPQRLPSTADLDFSLDCNAHNGRFHPMFTSDSMNLVGLCGGDQHARRALVEQQEIRAKLRIQVDAGADAAEGRFGQRNGQTAIAQV